MINHFRKLKPSDRPSNEVWSGEASRGGGFAVEETRVDVSIGDSNDSLDSAPKKERPIWMVESTVVTNDDDQAAAESLLERVAQTSSQPIATMPSAGASIINHTSRHKKDNEDIMSVLLAHEKQSNTKTSTAVKGLASNNHNSSDSSEDEKEIENAEIRNDYFKYV